MADKKRFRIKDRNGTVVPYDIAVEDITIDGEHKSLPQKLAEMAAAISEASQSWTPTEESIALANLTQAVQAILAKANTAVQPIDLNPINEAITTINRAIDAITGTTDTTDLIDSLNEVVDFLTGIENDETLSGKLLALQNAIDDKQDALTFDQAPTAGSDRPVKSGGVFAALEEKANADEVYDKDTIDDKLDEVAAERAAIISLEEVDILDQHDNNTVLAGASARQMRLAYLAINALYGKLNELIGALAGVAFSGEKTQPLAALDWTGAITQYTLTPSLSACTASITRGDAGNSKLYEGLVVIRLTPSSPTYTFSNIIVTKAGTAMDIDRTDNQDGTVDISFVCSGDVTVTATAVDGYGISLYNSPHLSVSQTHSGDTYTATLVPDEHFSLPDEIVVKKGVTTLVRNTDYTYNKATGKVVIYNVDADITIIAEVTEEAHVVLDMTGVGSNVVVKNEDDELVNGKHLYNSSALTIMLTPGDGYKFASAPSATIGGAQATMSGSSVYGSYSFVIAANVANGTTVAITASAIGLLPCNVSLPSVGNGIAGVALTDLSGNAISAPVNEGTGIKIVLTPSPGFRITEPQATMQNGTMPQPTNDNGVLTYTITSVTGDIQITATADEFGKVNVSKILRNMVLVSDNTDANGKITEGSTYTATLETAPMVTEEIAGKSPSTLPLYGNNIVGIWSAPTVVVKKGGVEVVGAYNASTGVITVNNVDDDIDVIAITEPKVFQYTHPAKDNSISEIYAEAYTGPFGVNSIYAHIPNGCTKIRWYHAAHETDMYYDSKTGRVFIPTFKGSNGLEWATMLSQPTMGGQGGQKFPFNYVDISFTAPSSEKKDFVYMMALFNQNKLGDCFLVDITNVDSSALATADAAAATAAGESGTQIVSASLDAIVDLGGNIIFDGRYSELTTLPSE